MIPDICSSYPKILMDSKNRIERIIELSLNYIRYWPEEYDRIMKLSTPSYEQLTLGNVQFISKTGNITEVDTNVTPYLAYVIDLKKGEEYLVVSKRAFEYKDILLSDQNSSKCIIIYINESVSPEDMIIDLNEYNFKRSKYRKQYNSWQDYLIERMGF